MAKSSDQPPGPGVDAEGRTAIDPSKNVDTLVDAAVRRLDDLRELESKWRDRFDQREVDHAQEIRRAESARIDAILEAQAVNVQRAADVQSGVAERLAAQVQGQAEVVRLALRNEIEPVQKDIADLRRVQYEGVGQKTQVVEQRAGTSLTTHIILAVVAFLSFVVLAVGTAVSVYFATH